jgi:hypothetical protein
MQFLFATERQWVLHLDMKAFRHEQESLSLQCIVIINSLLPPGKVLNVQNLMTGFHKQCPKGKKPLARIISF